jgi:hypothetical protein
MIAELRRVVYVGPLVSQPVTIRSPPDNVLLDIFDFYLVIHDEDGEM